MFLLFGTADVYRYVCLRASTLALLWCPFYTRAKRDLHNKVFYNILSNKNRLRSCWKWNIAGFDECMMHKVTPLYLHIWWGRQSWNYPHERYFHQNCWQGCNLCFASRGPGKVLTAEPSAVSHGKLMTVWKLFAALVGDYYFSVLHAFGAGRDIPTEWHLLWLEDGCR